MNAKRALFISILAASLSITGFAIAHDGDDSNSSPSGHMNSMGSMGSMGHMSGMMGMEFDHPMFDLDQLSVQMNLTNEQISILSQLEASHVQMQALMQTQELDSDGKFGHMNMMSMMSDNYELMSNHLDLYKQFEATLTDEQAELWSAQSENCH